MQHCLYDADVCQVSVIVRHNNKELILIILTCTYNVFNIDNPLRDFHRRTMHSARGGRVQAVITTGWHTSPSKLPFPRVPGLHLTQ